MAQLKNEFSWSKSRDGTFKECKRKYYYNYYGSWGGWEINVPEEIREIYILGKLRNRYMWTGGAVHDAIKDILEKVRIGITPSVDEVVDSTRNKMRSDFKSSRDKLYWNKPKTCALFEHEYEINIPDEKWREMSEHVEKCLRNFYSADIFKYIKDIGSSSWLPIEEFQSFPFEGTKINVKLDFPYRDKDDGIAIVDWKTGKSKTTTGDVQLLCYALFAMNEWNVDLENIKTIEYNLVRQKATESKVNTGKIDFVKDFIRESIGEMKGMLTDLEGNKTSKENFDRTDNERICNSCNFRKICQP